MGKAFVMLAALALGVVVGSLWLFPAPEDPLLAVVLEVPAPDTLTVHLPLYGMEGKRVTVRLRGVAAPTEQERLRVVTALLSKALVGRPVLLEAIRWTRAGEAMEAQVFRHGADDVAATLLRGGWADAASGPR